MLNSAQILSLGYWIFSVSQNLEFRILESENVEGIKNLELRVLESYNLEVRQNLNLRILESQNFEVSQ